MNTKDLAKILGERQVAGLPEYWYWINDGKVFEQRNREGSLEHEIDLPYTVIGSVNREITGLSASIEMFITGGLK